MATRFSVSSPRKVSRYTAWIARTPKRCSAASVTGSSARNGAARENGYTVTLRVIGRDDIAIVTNITSVIGKESNVTLRSLNINSVDGLFQGNFTVLVRDTTALNLLTKKIKAVNGVKTVERLNS